jgi:hypothetical protein
MQIYCFVCANRRMIWIYYRIDLNGKYVKKYYPSIWVDA